MCTYVHVLCSFKTEKMENVLFFTYILCLIENSQDSCIYMNECGNCVCVRACVYSADVDGVFIFFNQKIHKTLGYVCVNVKQGEGCISM